MSAVALWKRVKPYVVPLAALVAGAVIGLWWHWHLPLGPPFDPSDQDDRPPIIVSNGSVSLDAEKAKKNGHGKWVQDSANPKVWYHAHDNKPPVRFTLYISDITGGAGCNYPGHLASSVTELTVHYVDGDGQNPSSFVIRVANARLEVETAAPVTPDPRAEYVINLAGEGWKIESVEFKTAEADPNSLPTTCSFAGASNPTITVFQRYMK